MISEKLLQPTGDAVGKPIGGIRGCGRDLFRDDRAGQHITLG
jgi:hypothetical protein